MTNSADVKASGELVKNVGELIKSVGPTDDHRQAFGRTFFGTLLGQTVALLGMTGTYILSLIVIWRFFSDDLKAFYAALGVGWFWFIVAAPFVCILLFSMLPTAWRALRERRMKAAAIGGDTHFDAINFRPYPYGELDRAVFKRLDGADSMTLNWLTSTKMSVLYLSGASGVGKSSLLAASVLPKLRDAGWMVIETRLFGDPIDRLRIALIAGEPRLTRKAAVAEFSLRDLLETVTSSRGRRGEPPLLLVVDQFEEFLILYKEDQRQAFVAFLGDLVRRPIEGLRLLLVFRSDYRPLVFKFDLPPLVAGHNWTELAAYDRDEAVMFLRGGGRELSPETADRLFRGLDRIEDAPGMYRLITLNMVGLVLERMGRRLEGDPGRLIHSYLTACLRSGETRDFSQQLLAHMITEAGTKEPRTETDLAVVSGFAAWQVKATLAELARQGLVRRLEVAETTWEIAHDFLARVIGRLIGRLKPSLWQRTRPLLAPLVLSGWIAFATIAWPYWTAVYERNLEIGLRELDVSIQGTTATGISVMLPLSPLSAETARPYLEHLNPSELTIIRKIVSFEMLTRLTNLRTLRVYGCLGISLEPLKGLTNLKNLIIVDATGITSLEPLKGLANLETLDIAGATGITDLEPLKGLTRLVSLDISRVPGVTSLEPLKGLTNLDTLFLSATGVTSLEPLSGLTMLRVLDLDATRITSLEPLNGLTMLKVLNLSRATGITSLEPLKGLTNLETLGLYDATGITSLEPLKGLTELETLAIDGASGIIKLEPLKGLPNLRIYDVPLNAIQEGLGRKLLDATK